MWDPLRDLFLKGPRLGNYGFWQGGEMEDICAESTGTPARFWVLNKEACLEVIEKRYQAFRTVVVFGLYMMVLWQTLQIMQLVVFHLMISCVSASKRVRLGSSSNCEEALVKKVEG